jgi:lysyl-tRNA synthetase class 2
VEQLLDDIGHAYHQGIVAPGKEAHFLVLVSFLCSFAFIRTSAHMIRAQVSWWPGNVETKGGTHVHHLVWGILLLMICGYVGISVAPHSPWRQVIAILFGIGMGLSLDEFALWLNLEDVYWQAQGRESIDAVVIAVVLLAITLLGLSFWIDVLRAVLVFLGVGGEQLSARESTAALVPLQLIGVAMAVACFLKGKNLTGIVGLFVPAVALVGAVRLAKPGSRWARRYGRAKLERAEGRFAPAAG